MLGRSHALSGAVAGAATGLFLLHAPITGTADLAVLTAGFATLSDLDQCGSTASRSFGPVTSVFAHVVRKVSGGHRHGTHTAAGAAVFTGLTWLAGAYRSDWAGAAVLGVILAVGVSSGLEAIHPPRRGPGAVRRHYADLIAVAGAIAVCVTGWDLALVPVAAAAGVLAHIAGDELTRNGCPFFWPLTSRSFHLLPRRLRFTTGTWPEKRIVTPVLLGALAWLSYLAVSAAWYSHTAIHYSGHLPR